MWGMMSNYMLPCPNFVLFLGLYHDFQSDEDDAGYARCMHRLIMCLFDVQRGMEGVATVFIVFG